MTCLHKSNAINCITPQKLDLKRQEKCSQKRAEKKLVALQIALLSNYVNLLENNKNPAIVMITGFVVAPQVGLEPTTLRLTAACYYQLSY